jgi:hypothetical protein
MAGVTPDAFNRRYVSNVYSSKTKSTCANGNEDD